MNELALSLACATLLVASSATGAVAASTIAVNHGDSMEPTLCEGSVLVVDRDSSPEIGDIVSLRTTHGLVYHRLVDVRGQDLIVQGDNNDDIAYDMVVVDDREPDTVAPGQPVALPHRRDILGVVSTVVYDGCGPL